MSGFNNPMVGGGGGGGGINSINSLTASAQTLVTGTTGTDFGIVSASSSHTFNLPVASATNSGKLSSADWTLFQAKDNVFYTVALTGGDADYIATAGSAQTAINAAITAANAAGGGIVFIKPGTYSTNAVITQRDNVHIMGAGKTSTIIQGTAADYALIQSPTIGGTTAKNTYSNFRLSNLTLQHVQFDLLRLDHVSKLTIDGVRFRFNGVTPIIGKESCFLNYCEYVNVSHCDFSELWGNGVQINGCDYFNVWGNLINGGANGDDLINIDMDFLLTKAVKSTYGCVYGNTITNSGRGNGIRVESSDYIDIIGNSVSSVDTDGTPSDGSGIIINAYDTIDPLNTVTCENINVVGNNISNCLRYGIRVQSDNSQRVKNVLISNNVIKTTGTAPGTGPLTAGVLVQSNYTVVSNNLLDTCGATGGDAGAIIVLANNVTVKNNQINNSTNGINIWNGSGSATYTGVYVEGNTFNTVTNKIYSFTASTLNQAGVQIINPFRGTYDKGNVTGSFSLNTEDGDVQFVTLTGNSTLTAISGAVGRNQRLTLFVYQNATGGYTLGYGATFLFGAGGTPNLNLAASGFTALNFVYNGTNWLLTSANSINDIGTLSTPTGSINSVNTTFTLSTAPVSSSKCLVILNGIVLKLTTDYTISGSTLTMVLPPETGDLLQVYA